jgi:branched-chain amino acid transport system substrate-binding protein
MPRSRRWPTTRPRSRPSIRKRNRISLEGYLAGRLAVAAIEKTGKDLTRESLLKTIKATGSFDIGGLKMTYGSDHDGLDTVFMTVIQPDGSFKAVDKLTKVSRN